MQNNSIVSITQSYRFTLIVYLFISDFYILVTCLSIR